MPVHDWTRVDAATFHAFHGSWITHLMETLNDGVLPGDYYALSEQIVTRMHPDVVTLRATRPAQQRANGLAESGLAVAEAEPQALMAVLPNPNTPPRRPMRRGRRIVIRHASGNQVVAVIEIVSPANKDRRNSVHDIAGKIVRLLEGDVQVLLIDLLPATRYDPHGIHGAVWSYFDGTPYQPPPDAPLTLASYVWLGTYPKAYLQPVRVGQPLLPMPLFLNRERYIYVPLEPTYNAAYRGMPEIVRRVIEGADQP